MSCLLHGLEIPAQWPGGTFTEPYSRMKSCRIEKGLCGPFSENLQSNILSSILKKESKLPLSRRENLSVSRRKTSEFKFKNRTQVKINGKKYRVSILEISFESFHL
jgi:hypothetical protein